MHSLRLAHRNAVRDVEQTMTINSLAPMYVAREFLPGMIESGDECRVINLASSAGLNAVPRLAVYAGSKWAAIGWSDSVRLELEHAGHESRLNKVLSDVLPTRARDAWLRRVGVYNSMAQFTGRDPQA